MMPEPRKLDQVPSGCWVACIAAITHLPHDELTEFLPLDLRRLMELRNAAISERPDDWYDDERVIACNDAWNEYHNRVNEYLRSHGWRLAYLGEDAPRGFAMAYGPAVRGFDHAVVVLDGKLWHDPHPSRDGLLSVSAYELLVPLVAKEAA